MVDVYVSGFLDDDTVPRFVEVEKILTKHGLTVYNPEKYYGHEEVTDEEIRFYEKLLAEME